jgi:hypothetical protein
MYALRSWRGFLGALTLASLPTPAGAQPVGSEFKINSYTTSAQRYPSVASDASGNFVVVWGSVGQDGSDEGIFGQRYDSAGSALGSEFRVNSFTTNNQRLPSVASDTSGSFVVVWDSYGQDGSQEGIFGQRYDSGGVPQGDEFQVSSYTTRPQQIPSVASDASGDFVAVWESLQDDSPGGGVGIFGQRYDSGGGALGTEFHVNSFQDYNQLSPSLASDAAGNFVVIWESYYQENEGFWGIFGQRYDSAGSALGSEFHVNSTEEFYQRYPCVASDASGNFVVVWSGNGQGDANGIFGQRYDSAGGTLGSEFRVNSYTTSAQRYPSVASDASGNFVVVWGSLGQDGSDEGIFGQRYDSAGTALGSEYRINSFTTGAQQNPAVGATGTNQFVVVWQSNGQDGSSYGVIGQRFNFGSADAITVVSPNTNVKWRIGSLQRIKWTHNLGEQAAFRIQLDRDDDGHYEELIADGAPADSATRGHFAWTVTGPVSGIARVRVSWADDPSVSDASDVTFQIRPVPLDATASVRGSGTPMERSPH